MRVSAWGRRTALMSTRCGCAPPPRAPGTHACTPNRPPPAPAHPHTLHPHTLHPRAGRVTRPRWLASTSCARFATTQTCWSAPSGRRQRWVGGWWVGGRVLGGGMGGWGGGACHGTRPPRLCSLPPPCKNTPPLAPAAPQDYGNPERSGKMVVLAKLLEYWHAAGHKCAAAAAERGRGGRLLLSRPPPRNCPPHPSHHAGRWCLPRPSRCWTSWSAWLRDGVTPTTAWMGAPRWRCAPGWLTTLTTTTGVGGCSGGGGWGEGGHCEWVGGGSRRAPLLCDASEQLLTLSSPSLSPPLPSLLLPADNSRGGPGSQPDGRQPRRAVSAAGGLGRMCSSRRAAADPDTACAHARPRCHTQVRPRLEPLHRRAGPRACVAHRPDARGGHLPPDHGGDDRGEGVPPPGGWGVGVCAW